MKLSTRRSGAATPDAVLLQEAAAGSGGALATLYDRYERKIFNFCLRLTGSREDAADATQEAFLGVLRRLKTDDGPVFNFSAYLFTAARHESYKVSRRRARSYPSAEMPERRDAADELVAVDADPERSALVKSSQDEIRAANARLPPRYREVLALHDLEGASYEQIGEIMGMRGNAVAQLIFRARKRLRSDLKAGAVASFVAASDDCEHAQALISMREDGELRDQADREWLDRHLDECGPCRGSRAALLEVGAIYGAWVPVAAAVGLREDVLARGSELIGADWMAPANGGASNGAGSNGGGSDGLASHGGEGSARFATGAAGTAAVGLGIVGLLALLPGDDGKRATGERDASRPPAAQAAAEPARAGRRADARPSSDATRSARAAPRTPGASAPDAEQGPARSGGGAAPRARVRPVERGSPRSESPPPGPRPPHPRPPQNGKPGGAPVTEDSPSPELPPTAPPPAVVPPAPSVQQPPPSGCSHPWKPTATKPCPPGHSKPKRSR